MNRFMQKLGPGLLWAGAAIGGSHLIQSTRAGADYGYSLVWLILLINLIKYPFFEFGPRFTAATGKTLIQGYKELGVIYVIAFWCLSFLTMFIVTAALLVVSAGLLEPMFQLGLGIEKNVLILSMICGVLLLSGGFHAFERMIKVIICILAATTLFAAISSYVTIPVHKYFADLNFSDAKLVFFSAALIGWMPTVIEVSAWNSLWILEKNKNQKVKMTFKEILWDFNIGYFLTVLLAIAFVSLGSVLMFQSSQNLPDSGIAFAKSLIDMYTQSLGKWCFWIIAICAFTTIFSSLLTVLDAYSRVNEHCFEIIFPKKNKRRSRSGFALWLLFLLIGSNVFYFSMNHKMTKLLDFAATVSFLTAPFLAWLNLQLVLAPSFDAKYRPKGWLLILSYLGIAILVLFGCYYISIRFD